MIIKREKTKNELWGSRKSSVITHSLGEDINFLKYLKIILDKTKMLCYNSYAIDNNAIEM